MIIKAIFQAITLTVKCIILFVLVLIPCSVFVWGIQDYPKETLGIVLFSLFCVLVYDEYENLRLQKKADDIFNDEDDIFNDEDDFG